MNFVAVEDQLSMIAQIVRRCPTITLVKAFTRAYRDWAGQTQYVRLALPGTLVDGTQQYQLGNDPYVDIVGIAAVQLSQIVGTSTVPQFWALAASDPSLWNPNVNPDQPRRYAYIPQAQIAFNPTPNFAYTVNMTLIVQPKEGATQVPETGLIKYRNGIEAGALAYLHALPGQMWSNPNEVIRRQREFQASVNNARADVQRAFNTGSVRVRPRAFAR